MPEHIEVEVLMLKGDKGDAGATEWGGIAGEISDNNELQAALDKKADVESLKTVAISGKFPDLLEKPTTLRGYGVEPQTAYSEIKDLVKPNFSSLQGSPTENYNLKRELDNKTNVAQFNNLNREVSILQAAVNSRATATQVNELNNKVMSKADKSAISTINSTLSDKAERYEINNINNRLNAMLNRLNLIEKTLDSLDNNGFKLARQKEIFLLAYPIGAIFITFTSLNPRNMFDGQCGYWQLVEGKRVLVSVHPNDPNYRTARRTGGEEKHTLTVGEMPSHYHTVHDGKKIYYFFVSDKHDAPCHCHTYYDDSANPGDITSSAGNTQPHNNMQPYITAYFWERTG